MGRWNGEVGEDDVEYISGVMSDVGCVLRR
jgi:hypothetical protein